MISISVSSPPAVEPVSAANIKTQSRIDHTDDDDYIDDFIIPSVRKATEQYQSRSLITQTLVMKLDGWHDNDSGCLQIPLRRGPVQSITSVQYVDTDGTTQTLSTSLYTFVDDSVNPRIVPAYLAVWPSLRDVPEAVTVTYVAGYGDAATDVPETTRMAMLLWCAHLYQNREVMNLGGQLNEVPHAYAALLAQEKVPQVM